MLRVVHEGASKFKYVIQALAKINDEGVFVFGEDMFMANVMSPDKVTMAVLKVESISFASYEVEEPVSLQVRLDDLNKIVRRATRNDKLVFEYDVNQRILVVSLEDSKTGLLRQFEVPSMVLEGYKPREPNPEFTATIEMYSDDFKAIIQDAKVVGDLITFEAREDVFRVHVIGEEKEYEWIMRDGDPLIRLQVDEESRSSYTRQSLEATTKPTSAAEVVKLSFSTDYPLQVEFALPYGERLVVYTAPSIE